MNHLNSAVEWDKQLFEKHERSTVNETLTNECFVHKILAFIKPKKAFDSNIDLSFYIIESSE